MDLPSNEDEVVSSLIQFHKESHTDPEINPEQHYNHYGDRGIVDLFIETQSNGALQQWLYEAKSESAVRSVTGANEILRQFNRMRDFFFKGSEYKPGSYVQYQLVFVPTAYNLRHLANNDSLYQELAGVEKESGIVHHTEIALHVPSHDSPVVITDRVDDFTDEVFWEYMFHVDRDLARELEDTFEEICGPLSKTEVEEVDEYSARISGEVSRVAVGDETVTTHNYGGFCEGSHVEITGIEICPGAPEFEMQVELPENTDQNQSSRDFREGKVKVDFMSVYTLFSTF